MADIGDAPDDVSFILTIIFPFKSTSIFLQSIFDLSKKKKKKKPRDDQATTEKEVDENVSAEQATTTTTKEKKTKNVAFATESSKV